jgi:hypothetical protein
MNPGAVEQMVQLPGRFGRIVRMPTDSEFGVRRSSSLPETKQVLAIIARGDIALATGHIFARRESDAHPGSPRNGCQPPLPERRFSPGKEP